VVLRRVHKQGWSSGERNPTICDDGRTAVLDGGSRIEFETHCRRSTGPGASAAPASRVEVWRWRGDHYEQAGPDAGQ